jgi:hypothetical protein
MLVLFLLLFIVVIFEKDQLEAIQKTKQNNVTISHLFIDTPF